MISLRLFSIQKFQGASLSACPRLVFSQFTGSSQDLYALLGVNNSATKEEIKKQYYKLTRLYHPDLNKRNEDKFKLINQAWEVLGDHEKRRKYDSQKKIFSQSFEQSTERSNNNFKGQRPFEGQNPFAQSGFKFGPGTSQFGNMDINALLRELEKNGFKIDDITKGKNFAEIQSQMSGGQQQQHHTSFKDIVTQKVKQESLRFMLRKMHDKLEKEIQNHQEAREQQQSSSQQSNPQKTARSEQFNPFTKFSKQQENSQSQADQAKNRSSNFIQNLLYFFSSFFKKDK